MNRKTLLLVAIIGVLIALSIGFFANFNNRRIETQKRIYRANEQMKTICFDVGFAVAMKPELLSVSKDWNGIQTAREFYSGLIKDPVFSEDTRYQEAARTLLDPWKNEFFLRVEGKDSNLKVVIWSSGANNKNERGSGDDVFQECFLGESGAASQSLHEKSHAYGM
jgi:hypothetical protein